MTEGPTHRPHLKVGLISLGCAKNLVDAELMLGSLLQDGLEITNDATQADVVIVNTCSFIDAAQAESVDAILESAAVREAGRRGQGLVVAGCLPQRFRDELPKLLPEVDAFMGIDEVTRAPEIVRGAHAHRQTRIAPAGAAGELRTDRAPARGRSARVVDRLAVAGKPIPAAAPSRPRPRSRPAASGTPAATSRPLLEVQRRPRSIPDFATPRFRLTPGHFAYVKIAEGCNHPCSFCIIPRMRGRHRSRPVDDVVEEARRLLATGVKELNLISQDTTYYGLDLRAGQSRAIASPDRFAAAARALPADAPRLSTLLRALNALPGRFWIRLLYTHPAHWTDELIATLAACPKVARYVDMPLQHIHPLMLERMRRETTREYIVDLIRRLRAGVPGVALRTTFIVGFPGETEACFDALLAFIRATRFERLGVFVYSQEEGTIAGRMADQVPEGVKRRRRARAMTVQRAVARAAAAQQVGRELEALVEGVARPEDLQRAQVQSWEHGLVRARDAHPATLAGRYWSARGEADAPDIDGRVYLRGRLPVGEFVRVRIVGHTDYDLIGEPAASE